MADKITLTLIDADGEIKEVTNSFQTFFFIF